jgi:hypothetical protein
MKDIVGTLSQIGTRDVEFDDDDLLAELASLEGLEGLKGVEVAADPHPDAKAFVLPRAPRHTSSTLATADLATVSSSVSAV